MDTVTTIAEHELKGVFAAFREAEALSVWFGPKRVTARLTELDPGPADATAAK
jgi:hypothetical protein